MSHAVLVHYKPDNIIQQIGTDLQIEIRLTGTGSSGCCPPGRCTHRPVSSFGSMLDHFIAPVFTSPSRCRRNRQRQRSARSASQASIARGRVLFPVPTNSVPRFRINRGRCQIAPPLYPPSAAVVRHVERLPENRSGSFHSTHHAPAKTATWIRWVQRQGFFARRTPI